MKSALLDFRVGISQLLVFLERNLAEQELIALLNESPRRGILDEREILLLDKLLQAATNTKQYIYIVSIVSMYGLLERLVDNFVESFVLGLKNFSPLFSNLPEIIQKNHLRFSLALVDAVLKEKFRKESSPEAIVANLHSCLSGAQEYGLNAGAFALHRGNLNIDRIDEILSGVGVDKHLRRILKTSSFSEFLASLDPNTSQATTDEDVRKAFVCIDELVVRRNEVSHGVVQVDDLDSIELLMRRCAFVSEYGQALFEALEQEMLKHAAIGGAGLNMGKPIAVYNNQIVCFPANFCIAVGDRVFTLTRDALAPVRTSVVTSLQVENIDRQKVDIDPNMTFGAKVSFHAQEDVDYYLLQS